WGDEHCSLSFSGRDLKLGKQSCYLSSLTLIQHLAAEPHSIIDVCYLANQRIVLLMGKFDRRLIRPLYRPASRQNGKHLLVEENGGPTGVSPEPKSAAPGRKDEQSKPPRPIRAGHIVVMPEVGHHNRASQH